MRKAFVAVTLAGATTLRGALGGQGPSVTGTALIRAIDVTFESVAGHCGGMLTDRWIITARHCADDLSSVVEKPDKIAVRVAGVRYEYEGGELFRLLSAAPPNVAGEALSLDFALLPAPAALAGRWPPPDPIPPSEFAGMYVEFNGYEGRSKTCQVTSVCGAQVQIGCKGSNNAPVEGDSGHPVFTARSGRAIGILTVNSSDGSGAITSYATIMGRSRALASAWNELRKPPRHQCDLSRADGRYCALSREFARSSRYRYSLVDGRLCRRAVVHPKVVHRRVESDGFFTAVAPVDALIAVAADIRSGSLCTIRRSATAFENCTRLPAGFGKNVRAIVQLGTGQLLISQASTSKLPGGTGEWSRVALVDRNAATGALSFAQPMLVPLRQVTSAVRNEDGDLLVGGTGGICIVREGECPTIVWHAEDPGQSDWVARGLLRLGNGEILAVGRDYRDNSAAGGPSRRRIEIAR